MCISLAGAGRTIMCLNTLGVRWSVLWVLFAFFFVEGYFLGDDVSVKEKQLPEHSHPI